MINIGDRVVCTKSWNKCNYMSFEKGRIYYILDIVYKNNGEPYRYYVATDEYNFRSFAKRPNFHNYFITVAELAKRRDKKIDDILND